MDILKSHKESKDKEHKKRQDRKDELERIRREKAEAKERRRKEREAKRIQDELDALREELQRNFITPGETVTGTLNQQISPPSGYYSGQPTVGIIGDLILQLGIVISVAHHIIPEKNIINHSNITSIIGVLILQGMKCPNFNFYICAELTKLLNECDKKFEEVNLLEKDIKEKITEMVTKVENYEESLQIILGRADEIGLEPNLIRLIIHVLIRLVLRHPNKLKGKVMEARQKVTTFFQDNMSSNLQKPLKGIIRIRIPRIESKEEGEEENGEMEDEEVEVEEENEEESAKSIRNNKIQEKKWKEAKKDNESNIMEEEIKSYSGKAMNKLKAKSTLIESEILDQVLTIKTVNDTMRILVLHQAAERLLRFDIIDFLLSSFNELMEGIDPEELKNKTEDMAQKVEEIFLKHYEKIPIFDFEIN